MLLKSNKLIAIAILTTAMGLTGCNNSELEEQLSVLQGEYEILTAERDSLLEEVENLKNQVNSSLGIDGLGDGIDELETDNKTDNFVQIRSKITFDTTLRYKDSYQAPNTSKIMLSDLVTINPSNNWIIQMNGTSTKYNHSTGIVGEIIIGSVDELTDDVFMESEMLEPFIATLSQARGYNNRVYVEDKWSGMCSTQVISVDTGHATLKFGVIGYDKTTITYCFYYDGESDKAKNELIDTMIRTMRIKDKPVTVDA